MPPLHLLVKPASGLCNLRCKYCFYHDLTEKRNQASYGIMDKQTQENVLRKALSYADASCTIMYQGGEPTLAGLDYFRRGAELQSELNTKRLRIDNGIQTNGVGLDESWARFFADNRFLVGLSLDGAKDIHDLHRMDASGKGTFSQVLKTARLFDRFGVEYNVLTVVTASVARHIGSVYAFFKKNGFKYLQFIPCLDPIGEQAGQRDYSLTPQLYADFLKRLFDLWHRDLMSGSGVSIRTFDNYINMLLGYPPESCGMGGVCSIQNVVEANGDVYPCDFYALDEYRLGNLNTVGFEQINQRRRTIGFIERSATLSEKCRACRFLFICRGGCKRMRTDMDARGVPIEMYCEAYLSFFDYALDRMNAIAARVRR